MRAELRGIHCPDVDSLESWNPGTHFGIALLLLIGPAGAEGEESFEVQVCSPSWFEQWLAADEIRSGHHTIFMHEYDYRRLVSFVERAVRRVEAPTWQELAGKLSWLGRWEFEDYEP